MIIKCNSGNVEIKVEEDDLHVKVIVDKRTWYWNKDTGEYGTSSEVEKVAYENSPDTIVDESLKPSVISTK